MHGNVWEWCEDWYGEDYYLNSPKNDPTGPRSGTQRVSRGGAYYGYLNLVRSAARGKIDPKSRDDSFGFRVVRVAK